jgi:hypothetical protein
MRSQVKDELQNLKKEKDQWIEDIGKATTVERIDTECSEILQKRPFFLDLSKWSNEKIVIIKFGHFVILF